MSTDLRFDFALFYVNPSIPGYLQGLGHDYMGHKATLLRPLNLNLPGYLQGIHNTYLITFKDILYSIPDLKCAIVIQRSVLRNVEELLTGVFMTWEEEKLQALNDLCDVLQEYIKSKYLS